MNGKREMGGKIGKLKLAYRTIFMGRVDWKWKMCGAGVVRI